MKKMWKSLVMVSMCTVTAAVVVQASDSDTVGALVIEQEGKAPISKDICEATYQTIGRVSPINPDQVFPLNDEYRISARIFTDEAKPRHFQQSKVQFNWGRRSIVRAAGPGYQKIVEAHFYSMFPSSKLRENNIARLTTNKLALLCDLLTGELEVELNLSGTQDEEIVHPPKVSASAVLRLAKGVQNHSFASDLSLRNDNYIELEREMYKRIRGGFLLGFEAAKISELDVQSLDAMTIQILMTGLFDIKTQAPVPLSQLNPEAISEKTIIVEKVKKPFEANINLKVSQTL
jgi:hypothetical protein